MLRECSPSGSLRQLQLRGTKGYCQLKMNLDIQNDIFILMFGTSFGMTEVIEDQQGSSLHMASPGCWLGLPHSMSSWNKHTSCLLTAQELCVSLIEEHVPQNLSRWNQFSYRRSRPHVTRFQVLLVWIVLRPALPFLSGGTANIKTMIVCPCVPGNLRVPGWWRSEIHYDPFEAPGLLCQHSASLRSLNPHNGHSSKAEVPRA